MDCIFNAEDVCVHFLCCLIAKSDAALFSFCHLSSLKDRYSSLKPFHQKYALLATATDLLETFDFLDESDKEEVMMFQGNARKGALGPVLAWRRMKSITKDLDQTFLPKAKVLLEDEVDHEKSHDEICEMLLQSLHVSYLLCISRYQRLIFCAFPFLCLTNVHIATIRAKNKKQQQKKIAEAMGVGISEDVTEPLTGEDYENVCSNEAKKQAAEEGNA